MASLRFRERIRSSIADGSLQAALDANAERRTKGRAEAFASLPDWRERRQRAHAVRAEVIAHLDQYLAVFAERVAENGIIIHRAADAAQAVSHVLQIIEAARPETAPRSRGRLIAKSKSMVSEEIELNRALERAGHRVVETDLGEYIVQLRGEKPAHIITPAVHLRRHEVGRLFEEKLGLPFSDDIPTLTTAARRLLREVFLGAEVGISGVNFGVAETGALCIVTNEGNGRMVTTVPPVHIALMGMERLVPTLDDLALMLSLLPRSATGQKLSVYTQLIRAARATDEIDGAIERHLIIVDNGRSRIKDSRLQEALYCIRCGACLNACPVFREIGGHAYVGADGTIAPYPGPIGSIVSPGLLGLEQFGHLSQASSLCGACKDACPVDIDLPRLLTGVRAGFQQAASRGQVGAGLSLPSDWGLRAYGVLASSAALFSFAQRLAGWGARVLSPFSEWMGLPGFTGWGYSKDFPRPAATTFRRRLPQAGARLGEQATQLDTNAATKRATQPPPEAAAAAEAGADPVERFMQELEAVGAKAYRTTIAALGELLVGSLHERGIDTVLAWDDLEGVDEDRLRNAGVSLLRTVDPTVRAGITEADSAIAETGTIVLASGKGRPLSASLLTEVHIAIVRSSQIVWTLEQAFRNQTGREAPAVVLITGPSRTADIEMTLTIGVHGPKELIVFIVE